MKEKINIVNQKLLQIKKIESELQNFEQQVSKLKGTFYTTYTTKKWVPDTFKMKDEVDPNAPDEFNMEPATWKEVDEHEWVDRTPTKQEKQQLDLLKQEIRSREEAIHKLKGEMDVAKVMYTVKAVIRYLDPTRHARDIANLQDLENRSYSDLNDLQNHINTLSHGQSSVTRKLYEAIQKSNSSNIDVKLEAVSDKIVERENVHKNEKSFSFENFKNLFKKEIPRVNLDENSESEDKNSPML